VERTDVDRRWRRIADDLRRTVGKDLVLDMRVGARDPSDQEDWTWWEFDFSIDGEPGGTYGTNLPSEEEPFVVGLADYLDELVWGGWPICPDHNTHPLEPVLDEESTAVWKCPRGRIVAKIGQLTANS
jgi:hypothetical protein